MKVSTEVASYLLTGFRSYDFDVSIVKQFGPERPTCSILTLLLCRHDFKILICNRDNSIAHEVAHGTYNDETEFQFNKSDWKAHLDAEQLQHFNEMSKELLKLRIKNIEAEYAKNKEYITESKGVIKTLGESAKKSVVTEYMESIEALNTRNIKIDCIKRKALRQLKKLESA